MRRFVFLLSFLVLPVYSAVSCSSGSWNGTTCSEAARPVTYTVSCSSGAGNVSELQKVVNDAWSGDTAMLEAGCVWTNPALAVRGNRQGAGYLTVTSTEYAKLPPDGVRITPAYRPLTAIFAGTSGGNLMSVFSGARPANHIKIRGITFETVPGTFRTSSWAGGMVNLGSGRSTSSASSNSTTYAQGADAVNSLYANMRKLLTYHYDTTVAVGTSVGDTTLTVTDGSWAQPGLSVLIHGSSGSNAELLIIQSVNGNTLTFTTPQGRSHPAGQQVEVVVDRPEHQPDDVVFQHNLMLNSDRQTRIRPLMNLNCRSAIVRDNWIDGAMDYGASDAQAIAGVSGVGPYTIENNYIYGVTENILFGGAFPAWDLVPDGILFRFNFFPKWQKRDFMGTYAAAAGQEVWRGRHVNTGASGYFVATNSGVACPTPPVWPTDRLSSVTDCNGIVWRMANDSSSGLTTGKPLMKNTFELKNARNVIVQYNVLDGYWDNIALNTVQWAPVTIKSNNFPSTATTSTYACFPNCTWPDLHRGKTDGFWFKNNIIRQDEGGSFVFLGGGTGIPETGGSYHLWNNLIINKNATVPNYSTKALGSAIYFAGVVDCPTGSDCPNGQWVTPVWSVINNTFLNLSETTPPNAAIWLEKSLGGNMVGDFRITGNIMWNGTGFVSARNSTGAGTAGALQKLLGCSTDCDDDHFSGNIVLGAKQTAWKAGAVFSNCPSPAASCPDNIAATFDHPIYGQLFRNFAGGVYGVRDFHGWAKRATAWGDVGADTDQLPEIRNLRVTTTDTRALLQWQVTEPISVVPCIIHAGTTPDLESSHSYSWENVVPFSPAGELSEIQTYYGHDIDTYDGYTRSTTERMLVLGDKVPLSPDRTYWYMLSCGGDVKYDSFTTTSSVSGTTERPISRVGIGNTTSLMMLEYGYAYSRESDRITSSQTAFVSCSQGETCTVPISADRGKVLFYRWTELNADGATLDSGQVESVLVQ